MDFSIIVPVLNQPNYTKLCLDSIIGTSAKIIVVDNGSLAKTRAILSSYGSRISIIRNETNLGTGIALNQGIEAATTERIVMLHNDCIVIDGFEAVATDCFAEMETKNIKIASPLTNYSDETPFLWSRELQNSFTANKLCNKDRPTIEQIQESVRRTYEPFGGISRFGGRISKFPMLDRLLDVSSFCMLTFKSVFDQAGAFSKEFKFRGCEEKDLRCRYNQKGHVGGRAGFFVHHFGNITSDGPGFNFRQMLDMNEEIFDAVRKRYVIDDSWTAVIFPDKNPHLMERIKDNLADLDWPPAQIVEIPQPGIFPVTKAFDWVIPQIKHDVFGRLDADMLLRRNAVQKMIDPLRNSNIAMTAALLDDPCVGPCGSLVFWQTAPFKSIFHEKTPLMNYEGFYLEEIKRIGMCVHWLDEVLGDHAISLNPWVIFKAYFRRGLKMRIRGLGNRYAVDEISGAIVKGTPWSHLAMLAFHTGIKVDYRLDPHDEAYEAFSMEHYKQIRPFCEALAATATAAPVQSKPDTRTRVAFLTDCLEIGGMEIILKLVDELIDHSKFNVFIYAAMGGSLEKQLLSKNVRIANLPRRTRVMRDRISGWIAHDRIEVVVNMAMRHVAEIFENRKTCRLIERTDGSSFGSVMTPGIADLVVYESELMKTILPEFPCKEHVTITNGRKPFERDDAARLDIRNRLGMKEGELLVANIARIDEIKNQQHLILMAQELEKEGCVGFKVVIMGPDYEKYRVKLESLVTETKMEKRVFIFDETIGTREMLSAADVFVTASFTEGLSGALVEAAVAGLPIVATNVGATSEIVKDGFNGILIPPKDLPSLIAATRRMLTDGNFRQAAVRASAEIAKNHSAEDMTKQFERIIEEQAVIHRRQAKPAPKEPVRLLPAEDRITVLLPCRDQKKEFLEDAIGSVLAQTSPDWTLLVIVDPDTPEAVKSIVRSRVDERIQLVVSDSVPGSGVAGALNAGIRRTKSKFACILLSHDRLDLDAIAILKRNIEEYPEIDFFHSSRAYMNANGVVRKPVMNAQEKVTETHFRTVGSPVKHLLCWNIAKGLAAGGMDDELGLVGSDDYDFPWTMFKAGCNFKAIQECLYYYRVHHQFYRGTVNLPIEKHYEILRKMFKKHGVSEAEIEDFMRGAATTYLIQDKQRDFDKNMDGIIRLVHPRQMTEDRKEEFLSKGHFGRHFFAHKAYRLPKAGPDGLQLSKRTCGISDPSKVREIVLYASEDELAEFPKGIFFDKDLVWHEQHFGRVGQVATANLTVSENSIYGNGYVSDVYQRISRWRDWKTRIEKKFMGWPYMLYNAIMDFAIESRAAYFYSPTADKIVGSCIDPTRVVDREMFDAIYDRKLLECFDAVRDGNFWKIDVEKSKKRTVHLRQMDEIIEMPKTICICHDIERDMGHKSIPSFSNTDSVIDEMLAIEKEAGIKATYNVVGRLLEEVRGRIENDGHCVAFHSYDHDMQKEQLQRCRGVDYRIKGYRAPQSVMTKELSDENLCFYNFEWLGIDRKVFKNDLPVMSNGIVKMPILFDDFELYQLCRDRKERYAIWEENALKAIRENYFVAFSLHDCYAQYWLPHYREFLRKISGMGEFRTMDEVSARIILSNAA